MDYSKNGVETTDLPLVEGNKAGLLLHALYQHKLQRDRSLNLEGRQVGGQWGEADLGENGRGVPPLGLFGGSDVSLNLTGRCSE